MAPKAVRMRAWWRPGLPCLTEEGVLLIPNETEARKREELLKLYAALADGVFRDSVPEADLQLVGRLVLQGLDETE